MGGVLTTFILPLAQADPVERVERHIEFLRWSSGNPLLVGGLFTAAAIYAVTWFYHREGRGSTTPRLRWIMIACRLLVLLTIGMICLEPVRVNYLHRRLDAATIVLADDSASMSLVDPYREEAAYRRVQSFLGDRPSSTDGARLQPVSRAILMQRLMMGEPSLLDGLANNNTVKVISFAQRASLLASLPMNDPANALPRAPVTSNTADPFAFAAAGPVTDLGHAVRHALDSLGGAAPSAVVLLSDGGFNSGEPIDAIAALLKQKSIPLYAVGIGDPADPINLAVTDVSAPRVVFKNDPFDVTVRMTAQGLADREIEVELLETINHGDPKSVETLRVRPAPEGAVPPVVFKRKSASAGSITYLAVAKAAEGESVLSDNRRQAVPAVRVLDDKIRVLLVGGSPGYDYRYLARMLERDKSVDVSCWLQSADARAVRDGNTIITELPAAAEELQKYDAILLLDADPALLESAWAGLVATFVSDHGGGLLYQAGNKYTGRFLRSPNTAALVDLLPVVPDPDAEIMINELGQYQTRSFPIVVTDHGLSDPILRLNDGSASNRDIWAALDGAYWHYPVRREKSVAQVLLRHSDPRMAGSYGSHVLLATQLVGAGRSAYLGFNTTWRWRRGEEKLFDRFWTQLLRFLVEGRLMGGPSRCQIQLDREEYEPGEAIVVIVRALDAQFQPMQVPQIDAVLRVVPATGETTAEESQTLALSPISGREGYYQGRFVADRPGTLRFSVTPPGTPTVEKDVVVVRSDMEMRDTAMHRAALKKLAEATGGQYLEMDEAARLAELIPNRSRVHVVRERPTPLWDNAYVVMLLVAALTIEWILRKKAKLL